MTNKLQKKIVDLSLSLKDKPNGKNKHFSFILHRNRILSVGYNDYYVTHTKCKKLGYRFDAMHSELAAVLKFRGDKSKLKRCTLINIRVNSLNQIGRSRPCKHCMKLIKSCNFRAVYYTNADGQFELLQCPN